jgi:hypothetical protein
MVLYPIFLAYKRLATDDEWKEIFAQAAEGNFPKYYYYNSNGYLVYRSKSKIKVGEPNRENYERLCRFFRCMSNIGTIPDSTSEEPTPRQRKPRVTKRKVKQLITDEDVLYSTRKRHHCPDFYSLWLRYIKHMAGDGSMSVSAE